MRGKLLKSKFNQEKGPNKLIAESFMLKNEKKLINYVPLKKYIVETKKILKLLNRLELFRIYWSHSAFC